MAGVKALRRIQLAKELAGQVASIVVNNAGSGYSPGTYTSTASGGGGSGATASYTVGVGGTITSVVLTNAGSGYATLPTFPATNGGGSGGTFTVTLSATGIPSALATAIWRGTGTLQDNRLVTFPPEDVGYLSPPNRAYIPKLAALLALDATPATFEQLLYLFAAGVQNVITGAADGGGTDKVFTYALAQGTKQAPQTFTLQGGDDQEAEQMEYGFVADFKLAGKAGEAWMMSANWQGRQITEQGTGSPVFAGFSTAPTLPTVEELLFGQSKLYIDNVGGTFGTTQKSNTFLDAELNVKTGQLPVFTGSGNLYFDLLQQVASEVTLGITFLHDGTATAEKANWRNKVTRLLQIKCVGNAVQTPGSTYANKTFIANLAGKWEKFDKLGESNGNDVIKGTFRVRLDTTNYAQFIVVNELTALP